MKQLELKLHKLQDLFLVTLCILILFTVMTSACYVRNCPLGGKRSPDEQTPLKCGHCGPFGLGQCTASGVCCSIISGCFSISTSECNSWNSYLTTSCTLRGLHCKSKNSTGILVSSDICCTNGHCRPYTTKRLSSITKASNKLPFKSRPNPTPSLKNFNKEDPLDTKDTHTILVKYVNYEYERTVKWQETSFLPILICRNESLNCFDLAMLDVGS